MAVFIPYLIKLSISLAVVYLFYQLCRNFTRTHRQNLGFHTQIKEVALQLKEFIWSLFKQLGLLINFKKSCGPSQLIEWNGHEFNSVQGTVRLRGKIIEKVPESRAGSDCEITSCAAGASSAQRVRDRGGCACADARRKGSGHP